MGELSLVGPLGLVTRVDAVSGFTEVTRSGGDVGDPAVFIYA